MKCIHDPACVCARKIMDAFQDAEDELMGMTAVLYDGKAGTIGKIWLSKSHGIRVLLVGHEGHWPLSSVKFIQHRN